MNTLQQTPNVLRAKEASKYLGIAVSTLWLYAKQGKINPIKLSQRVTVFKTSELDEFINSQIGVA